METRWRRFRYLPNTPAGADGQRVTACAEHLSLSEEAAGEGIVLLKNEGILPLRKGTRVALFGKAVFDYVKGGGGSGDVTVSHTVNLYDGLKNLGGAVQVSEATIPFYREHVEKARADKIAPGCVAEPALPADLLRRAAAEADVAILVISRFSGEGWDRKLDDSVSSPWSEFTKEEHQSAALFKRGDYYLSDGEQALADAVKKAFSKVVVLLNVGGIVDTEWFRTDRRIGAALFIGQGGICGGNAAAKVLTGAVVPSGHLVDTWAKDIQAYPSTKGFFKSDAYVDYEEDIYVGYRYFSTMKKAADEVAYPFGYGLSYTEFSVEAGTMTGDGDLLTLPVTVTNRGKFAGREVVQLYAEPPQGVLGKPSRILAAFAKTGLLTPGASEQLFITADLKDLASYDDLGKVKKSAWILEKGTYRFHVGVNVRDALPVAQEFTVAKDRVVKQLREHLAPCGLKRRLTASGKYESLPVSKKTQEKEKLPKLALSSWDGFAPGVREVPAANLWKGPKAKLSDVAEGKTTLKSFLKQLSDEDLCWMAGGQPNTGVANTWGLGNNAYFGIPSVMTADGPAGLRTQPETGVTTTAWPVATTLACTWDPALLERVGEAAALEVKENNIGVWLAPAMNIHRSPLCGRNFEYFSEDPLVAGRMAAAIVRGVQSQHIAATIKHFAFNNKETNRRESDSRVSERAAREIYLRAFEITVKEADPWCVMTSYNLVNGVHTSENTELLTDILRGEWGYRGLVMTDWWSTGDPWRDLAAGIDLRMPHGVPARLREALKKGVITRKDLERSATKILELLLELD